jgi:polar amino acid transport system substrate-binding protein
VTSHSPFVPKRYPALQQRMSRWLAFFAISIAALHAPSLACAVDLRVTFNTDKPPFSYQDKKGKATGIEVDVMREVLARCGYGMRAIQVSKARLLAAVRSGEADAAASVQGKDNGELYFSNDFIEYANYAISHKDRHIHLDRIEDLDRHSFVIWQRAWADLGPEFEAKYKPDAAGKFPSNYFQGSTQEAQSRIFWAKRVELIVVDKTIFDWYRRELAAGGIKVDEEVVFHDIFKSQTGFAVAFKSGVLRDKFNQMLTSVRTDGTYQKILSKYK